MVLSAADLVHFFSEIKFCIHLISFIMSLLCYKLYYFMQHNISTRYQSAVSAVVVSHDRNASLKFTVPLANSSPSLAQISATKIDYREQLNTLKLNVNVKFFMSKMLVKRV